MSQDRFSLLLYRTCLLGCFLGLTATLYFLGGVAGYIGNPLLNIAAASIVLLVALFFLSIFFISLPDKSRLGSLLWFLILSVLAIEVVLGLVPPVARDELTHHLAVPRLYVNAGRILEISFALHSYYPMLLDMLYTPFIKWGWDSAPKLIHALFGFFTGLLLYAYLARRLSPSYGLLGFFFFISIPIVLKLGNLAYVDLGLTFYSTASLLCLLRWIEEVKSKQWLVLSGLSAGFALSTKPNGFLVFLLIFFLLALTLERIGQEKTLATARWSALFVLLAFIPFSPWFFKNWSQTGNPFFPFLTGILGGLGGDGGLADEGSRLGILVKRQLLYGESGWQIVVLPLRIFFSGQDNNPQYFDGVLNPILILFLPWAFKGKWPHEKRFLFGFALFYFVLTFFLTDLRIRYLLPVVPPLVILLVYGIHNVYLRIVHPSSLFAVVIFLLGLNGTYLWGYFLEVSPVVYLRGKESREDYLGRMLPDYPAFQYINRNLPSQAKVYLLFTGNRGYYCEREYFYDTSETGRTLLRILRSANDERSIREELGKQGITHLLIRQDLLLRFLGNNLAPGQRETWIRFRSRYLKILFELGEYGVYEVQRDA